jgi:hypothetical protein
VAEVSPRGSFNQNLMPPFRFFRKNRISFKKCKFPRENQEKYIPNLKFILQEIALSG